MKFRGRRKSSNINDGRSGGGGLGKGGLGIGGLIIVILFTLLNGGNVQDIFQEQSSIHPSQQTQGQGVQNVQQEKDQLYDFTAVVLADTEDAWTDIFNQLGRSYNPPQTLVYSGSSQSGCGFASAQIGPFYCPTDQTVYLDLSFYEDLHQKFGASGDFSFAYVIAHEVGHHVQKQLGVLEQVQNVQRKLSEEEANKWNVALELQADYLAGVVARYQSEAGYLEQGDISEAISATHAVGDDTIQKRSQGYVVPDSFTHGTAKQRQEWYEKGYQAGNLDKWDTFTALELQ